MPFSVAIPGALRVLDGQFPYRDFWTIYAPGQFWLLAGLFRLFGRELIVAALANVVLVGAACGVIFTLARRLGASRAAATAATLLFGAIFFRMAPTLTSYQPALLLILIGVVQALRGVDESEVSPSASATRALSLIAGPRFRAGLCFGAAAWFNPDV